jgi:[ribosomal protein S18]-alanine N-acetyltransferase
MIRHALATEAETIAAIEASCFGKDGWSESLVRSEMLAEHRVVLIDDADAYGVMSVAGDVADLDRIAVMPSRRRQGAARSLLDWFVVAARDRGATRMLLEVAADNTAAIALYEAYGFTVINRRTDYYRRGTDALVMELPLGEPAWEGRA